MIELGECIICKKKENKKGERRQEGAEDKESANKQEPEVIKRNKQAG